MPLDRSPSPRPTALLLGVSALAALGLSACERQKHADVIVGGHALAVASRLNCPEEAGDLHLSSQAPDGQSCDYRGREDVEVTLRRVDLIDGGPDKAAQDVEHRLGALVPQAAHESDASIKVEKRSAKDDDSRADIDLPFVHIHADGDKADVKLPGVHVNADGDGAEVKTDLGGLKNGVLKANDKGVVVRADATDRANVDLSWIMVASEPGPDGWRRVGYVLRGPKTGPLVAAELRSRQGDNDHINYRFGLDNLRTLVAKSLK